MSMMEINGKPLAVARQQPGRLQLALVLQHVRASEDRAAVELEQLERQGDRADEDVAVYEVLQRHLQSTHSVSSHRRREGERERDGERERERERERVSEREKERESE